MPRRVGNFFTLEVFAAFACIQERSNLNGERTLRPLSLHRRELRAHISEFWREVRRRHVLLTQPACRGDFVVEILCPRECGRLPQYRNGIPLHHVRALLGAVVCVAMKVCAIGVDQTDALPVGFVLQAVLEFGKIGGCIFAARRRGDIQLNDWGVAVVGQQEFAVTREIGVCGVSHGDLINLALRETVEIQATGLIEGHKVTRNSTLIKRCNGQLEFGAIGAGFEVGRPRPSGRRKLGEGKRAQAKRGANRA